MINRLSHAEIAVTDLQRSREFYCDVLGFVAFAESSQALWLRAPDEFDVWSLKLRRDHEPGLLAFGFRVDRDAALDALAGLHDQVCRTAAGLRSLGLQPEQRVMMLMADTPQFVVVYLAAMRMGAIPVPVSTMLRVDGLVELLRDSRARMLAVTADFTAVAAEAIVNAPELQAVLTGAGATVNTTIDVHSLDDLAATRIEETATVPTSPDSPAGGQTFCKKMVTRPEMLLPAMIFNPDLRANNLRTSLMSMSFISRVSRTTDFCGRSAEG